MPTVRLAFLLTHVGASAESERGDKIPIVTLVHSTRCRYQATTSKLVCVIVAADWRSSPPSKEIPILGRAGQSRMTFDGNASARAMEPQIDLKRPRNAACSL
jgi:hypothetical protein